jgi:hypothetical protein
MTENVMTDNDGVRHNRPKYQSTRANRKIGVGVEGLRQNTGVGKKDLRKITHKTIADHTREEKTNGTRGTRQVNADHDWGGGARQPRTRVFYLIETTAFWP